MSKASILFVITDFLYVRNYVSSGALKELEKSHRVRFVLAAHLDGVQTGIRDESIVGKFSYATKLLKRHQRFFQVLAWNQREKSQTFVYRWLRQSNWDVVRTKQGLAELLTSLAKWIFGLLRNPAPILTVIFGSKFLFTWVRRHYVSSLPVNGELRKILRVERWDAIVFPSAGYDPAAMDVARLGKELQIPTIGLIDNWDNLISKTVFWAKPDVIGVWGKQATRQAMSVQGFRREQIIEIGTPRFDQYFHSRTPLTEVGPQNYILFVGSAMPFDELSALHRIEEALDSLGELARGISVLYRPHPWQQKRLTPHRFDDQAFSRTALDPQMKEAGLNRTKKASGDTSFQPTLSYYPELFRNARLVVGPLTTMLFEASLCLRPVIALAYPDGFHFNTSVKYFTHFDGMDSVPGLRFCHDSDHLATALDSGLRHYTLTAESVDSASQEFLHISPDPYAMRLKNLVESVIAGNNANATG